MGRGGEEELVLLHVDDQPAYGELLSAFFQQLQDDRVTVICEDGVHQGLATIASQPVDCVISDLQMPRRDGLQFLKAVRNEHDHLPFVLYTNRTSEEVAKRAADHGVMPLLQSDITGYFRKDGRQTLELLTEWIFTTLSSDSTAEEQDGGDSYISGP